MSRGYWIAAIAFGLVIFTHSGQAQEKADDSQGQAHTEQRPATTLYPPIRVEIVEDQSETDARQHREAESRDREIKDLIAQEGMNAATQAMNDATQRMTDYALYSTVITAIGSLLIVGTLWLMIQANRAALKAANAAEESVKAVEMIGEKQLRAYVGVEVADIGDISQIPIWDVKAKISFRNNGQTPANITSYWYNFDIIKREDVDDLSNLLCEGRQNTISSQISLGPNVGVFERDAFISNYANEEDHKLAVLGKSARYTAYGEINYVDVFDKTHTTTFCRVYDFIETGPVISQPHPLGLATYTSAPRIYRWVQTEEYNKAD